jgi:hypothetical protein
MMHRPWLLRAAALCCIGLGACRDEVAQTPPASSANKPTSAISTAASPAPVGAYTIRHRIHPSLPDFVFTPVGDAAPDTAESIRIKRIEIRRGTAAEPFQVIDGLETETPIAAGKPELALQDMNFDGYADLRIIELRSAGPNTAYLNWLFDPATQKFLESRELNEIPSAQFDAVNRQIRSSWRDGATRYGTDVYEFSDGRPVLVRKEERTYRSPAVYELKISQLAAGTWQTIEQREVRQAEDPDGADSSRTTK